MFLSSLLDGSVASALVLCVGVVVAGLVAYGLFRVLGRGNRAADHMGQRPSRLSLVDAFDLDRHRQLVIVRRDNVEHLIMIGGPNDLLIEGGIVCASSVALDLDHETGKGSSEKGSVRRLVSEAAAQATSAAQNPSFNSSTVSKSAGSERVDEDKQASSALRAAPVVGAPLSSLSTRWPSTQLPPRPVLLSRDQEQASRAGFSRQPEKTRLTMIDRLEEEMSKLLSQPPDQPKS